ncbi:N-acetylmuramidase domain-containing protein [Caulobacter endophyticus]|uniref:Peptidoglycan-binding protein n=1 Tax=Caulobacter endophyticus TaxID=2172652 RepID=A0A2T9K3U1_9CAUL|nr:N-acetylmuramidase family protein [Caulobacter endophyticus]PVM90649.1 peptidoglycan-binding protein [Caulobacter endophyticus]
MDVRDLQRRLTALGLYAGAVDGQFGPLSRAAFFAALSSPARRLTDADLDQAASLHGLTAAHVGALVDVEASGRGQDPATGRPVIRYEGHQFRSRTGNDFDGRYPALSFPYADRAKRVQPSAQVGRWELLAAAVALVPGAALEATSWGLGQIMGFNYAACGFPDVWTFVRAMAASERDQLVAMLSFLQSEGLLKHLKEKRWDRLAAGYNGPSYRDNAYDERLAKAYARRGGK